MLNIFDKHLLKIIIHQFLVFNVNKDAKGTIALRKELTSNDISDDGHTLVMSLTPSDTMLITGEYPYDVLLSTFDGQVITFISSYMVIRPAVGLADNTGGET